MTAGAEVAQGSLRVIPDKRRSRADPGSIVGWCALRWIPGQARNDGEVQCELEAPAAGAMASDQAWSHGRKRL